MFVLVTQQVMLLVHLGAGSQTAVAQLAARADKAEANTAQLKARADKAEANTAQLKVRAEKAEADSVQLKAHADSEIQQLKAENAAIKSFLCEQNSQSKLCQK